MIADSGKDLFDVIIVHKLDRFARNRYDSAHYKYQLKQTDISLYSVTENLDGSPESIIMESVLEGMAEYYSCNLAREVEKGKRENALKGKHVGGIPPLGYELDRTTMKLVICERETEAVKLIFKLYLQGYGYSEIISELNKQGYKTKRNKSFGKGSLYEILRNEKYTGVYIYNKSAAKSHDGKYNRHSYKEDEEIIRLENGVPQIISKSDFALVQKKMKERKHKAAKYSAKQTYLLTGKIICGECGSAYVGNSRRPRPDHPLYVSYRCGHKNGAVKCTNPEVNREELEHIILEKLADCVFDDKLLPKLLDKYNNYITKRDYDFCRQKAAIEKNLAEINKGIQNIVKVVMQSGSVALSEQLAILEREKVTLETRLLEMKNSLATSQIDNKKLASSFRKAKEMLKNGSLANRRAIVEEYIDKVIIYKDKIDIKFNVIKDFDIKEVYYR